MKRALLVLIPLLLLGLTFLATSRRPEAEADVRAFVRGLDPIGHPLLRDVAPGTPLMEEISFGSGPLTSRALLLRAESAFPSSEGWDRFITPNGKSFFSRAYDSALLALLRRAGALGSDGDGGNVSIEVEGTVVRITSYNRRLFAPSQ